MGDGVAHPHLAACLDAGDDVSHIARRQLLPRTHVELQHSHLVGIILLACGHKLHEVILRDGAVHNLEIGDDAAEGVEDRVENQSLERRVRVALGGGHALHNGTEDVLHTHAGFARCADDVLMFAAQQLHNLVLHLLGLGRVEVALVHDRYDFQVVVDGHVEVGDGLRLDALRGVHNQ